MEEMMALFEKLDPSWVVVRDSRPFQEYGMSVQAYYDEFCIWKEQLDGLHYPADEKAYVADFLCGLKWDLVGRVYAYKSKPSRLSDAFYRAKIEESMICIGSALGRSTMVTVEDKEFDEMPSLISVDETNDKVADEVSDEDIDTEVVPKIRDIEVKAHSPFVKEAFSELLASQGLVLVEMPKHTSVGEFDEASDLVLVLNDLKEPVNKPDADVSYIDEKSAFGELVESRLVVTKVAGLVFDEMAQPFHVEKNEAIVKASYFVRGIFDLGAAVIKGMSNSDHYAPFLDEEWNYDKANSDDRNERKDIIYLFVNAVMFLFDPGGSSCPLCTWRVENIFPFSKTQLNDLFIIAVFFYVCAKCCDDHMIERQIDLEGRSDLTENMTVNNDGVLGSLENDWIAVSFSFTEKCHFIIKETVTFIGSMSWSLNEIFSSLCVDGYLTHSVLSDIVEVLIVNTNGLKEVLDKYFLQQGLWKLKYNDKGDYNSTFDDSDDGFKGGRGGLLMDFCRIFEMGLDRFTHYVETLGVYIILLSVKEESRVLVVAEEVEKDPYTYLSLKEYFVKTFKVMNKELKLYTSIICLCSGTTILAIGPGYCEILMNMDRAYANFCLKRNGLISMPKIAYRCLTNRDEFVIWDVLSKQEVIDIVASSPTPSIVSLESELVITYCLSLGEYTTFTIAGAFSFEDELKLVKLRGEDRQIYISSAIYFGRGKAYEALESRAHARLWYKFAVKDGLLCYKALEQLRENQMPTYDKEVSLLSSLHFCAEHGWISSFYTYLIKENDKENAVEAKFQEFEKGYSILKPLDKSFLYTMKIEYYHQYGEYQKCFQLISILLESDHFYAKSRMVHLAVVMELGNSNELYMLPCSLLRDSVVVDVDLLKKSKRDFYMYLAVHDCYESLECGHVALMEFFVWDPGIEHTFIFTSLRTRMFFLKGKEMS